MLVAMNVRRFLPGWQGNLLLKWSHPVIGYRPVLSLAPCRSLEELPAPHQPHKYVAIADDYQEAGEWVRHLVIVINSYRCGESDLARYSPYEGVKSSQEILELAMLPSEFPLLDSFPYHRAIRHNRECSETEPTSEVAPMPLQQKVL